MREGGGAWERRRLPLCLLPPTERQRNDGVEQGELSVEDGLLHQAQAHGIRGPRKHAEAKEQPFLGLEEAEAEKVGPLVERQPEEGVKEGAKLVEFHTKDDLAAKDEEVPLEQALRAPYFLPDCGCDGVAGAVRRVQRINDDLRGLLGPPQGVCYHIPRRRVNEACCASEPYNSLISQRHPTSHGDVAQLLLVHLLNLYTMVGQTLVTLFLQIVKGHRWLPDERRLLDKNPGVAHGHDVEEERNLVCLAPLLCTALHVLGAKVHQKHLIDGPRV
mmetsp:Transcript_6483/g.19680  ORF Transcript_6483/g.19680 Transcript_6483/m.19680 type:complete len:274 (-) Transcript_6483:677-1498(-)